MRQTALIVLMAYIGSFVPAQRAVLGPIDRIFTRVGAADDLAAGHSTFMVEMTETAYILHNATANSLVLMDEVGRGTSTFDGMSLAWATAVELGNHLRAFTLFATHYLELTRLADEYQEIANVHLDAEEYGEDVVFLHQVQEGPASRSYGLQVAALAGVPQHVIALARQHLQELEQPRTQPGKASNKTKVTPLPSANKVQPAARPQLDLLVPPTPPALERLRQVDPDALTPRQALEALYELKKLL